ncbi:TraM recognition domain-containing protein [Nonomuraea endophytica]|uniref:TraM recognition domain-containing protein n=1 Tax=Nonomuraea endophytica TaxID=714136 RepID=UPI0037C83636
MEERWGQRGAKTIWNSSKAKLFFGGTSDPDGLERVSKLCGEITLPQWEQSRDARGERIRTRRLETAPVLLAEQARMLPTRRVVAVRRNARTMIVRVWARADVKRWHRSGAAIPLPRLEHGRLVLPIRRRASPWCWPRMSHEEKGERLAELAD